MNESMKDLNIPNLNKNNKCNFNNFYTNDKKLSLYMYISSNNSKKYNTNNNNNNKNSNKSNYNNNNNLNSQRKKLTTLPISNINTLTKEKLEDDGWKECLKITSENSEIINKFSNLLNTNSSKQINLIIKLIEKLHKELKMNNSLCNQYKLELTWDNIHKNNENSNITIISAYQIDKQLKQYLDNDDNDNDNNLIKK